MTDYPERINISPVHRQQREDDFYLVDRQAFPNKGVEYTRTDLHLALLAAAYKAAGDWFEDCEGTSCGVEWLTPDDAVAALERVKSEERERTIQSCTHYCTDCGNVVPVDADGRGACGHGRVYDVRPEALERMLREARNDALREAAEIAGVKDKKGKSLSGPHHAGLRDGRNEAKRLILALMEDENDE